MVAEFPNWAIINLYLVAKGPYPGPALEPRRRDHVLDETMEETVAETTQEVRWGRKWRPDKDVGDHTASPNTIYARHE